MATLFIGIVTPTGDPRNPELINMLNNLSSEVQMAGKSTENLEFEQESNLSLPELACKMSHELMYKLAIQNHDWALIVEDDVQIDLVKLEEIWNLIQQSTLPCATIVSCYLGKWSVVKTSKNMKGALSSLYPPDGALCYFINRQAMKLAVDNFDYVKPADWPLWSRQVNFQVFPGVASEIPGVLSLIDPEQNRLIKSRNFKARFEEFAGIAYFKTYGFTPKAFSSIWYWEYRLRFTWYFPFLYGARRSSTLL